MGEPPAKRAAKRAHGDGGLGLGRDGVNHAGGHVGDWHVADLDGHGLGALLGCLVLGALAVLDHHLALQLGDAGRGPDQRVGAGLHRGVLDLGTLAAGGDDGQVGVGLAKRADDLGGVLAGRDVDDAGAGLDLLAGDIVEARDGRHHGDVHGRGDLTHHLGRGGGVKHDARSALHLADGSQLGGAPARGGAAAHAHKQRRLGHGEQGLRDGGLGGKGVDGKDGVGVGVADHGDVGGVEQALDAAAKQGEAGAFLVGLGDAKRSLAQAPVDGLRPVGGGNKVATCGFLLGKDDLLRLRVVCHGFFSVHARHYSTSFLLPQTGV